jgi:hypothetical protein
MFSGDSGYDPVGEWHLPRTALNMNFGRLDDVEYALER